MYLFTTIPSDVSGCLSGYLCVALTPLWFTVFFRKVAYGVHPVEVAEEVLCTVSRKKQEVLMANPIPRAAVYIRTFFPELFFAIVASGIREKLKTEEENWFCFVLFPAFDLKKSLYFKCQLFLLLTTSRIKQEALLNMNQPMSHLVIRYQWHTFVCGISTLLTMNILTVNMTRCHCLHYSSMEKTTRNTIGFTRKWFPV